MSGIPVGEPVFVSITSIDVIHSFWVPRLAGKQEPCNGRSHGLTLTTGRRAPRSFNA